MKPQFVAIPLALIFLLLGVVLGVLRLLSLQGIISQVPLSFLQSHHGELMVFGFLAPLIITERYLGATAFSLKSGLRFMPLLVTIGAVLKFLAWISQLDILNIVGNLLIALALVFYLYLLYRVARQSAQSLPFLYMGLGAFLLFVGAFINITRSPAGNLAFTLLLLSFPIFTIVGERVELSRFVAPQTYRWAHWGWWLTLVASLLLLLRILAVNSSYLVMGWAILIAGAVIPLLGPELTLVRLGRKGLHQYLGRHLIVAYIWLFLGLIILMVARENHPLYDAAAHSLALGFVLTMILAHAPVIAPVILHRQVAEERLHYFPLALLTLSTMMRVVGYLLQAGEIRIPALAGFSGVVGLVALLVFGAMLLRSLKPSQ